MQLGVLTISILLYSTYSQTPGYEGAFGERGAEEVVFTLLCGIPSLARQCSHSAAARLRHQEVNAQCWDPLLVSDSAGLGRDLWARLSDPVSGDVDAAVRTPHLQILRTPVPGRTHKGGRPHKGQGTWSAEPSGPFQGC